jgi:hypothetical protein
MASYLTSQDPPPIEASGLSLVERLGVPIFLVLFICAIIWKLLPHVVAWFQASIKSQDVIIEAVPDMRESLHRLANDGQKTLDIIDRRTQKMEEQLDDINGRMSKTG